ncbi:MAG TPA: hypothetical protein VHO71_04870 [Caproiciproducens sp.]|nr:hypothetical protein [Caproiciproducens sp.]
MARYPNWTKEEYDYLMDNWGRVSLGGISKHLNRSENSIKVKVFRLGLGAFLDSGDYITFNQLSIALGRGTADKYMLTSWVKNRNFPVKYKTVGENRFRVVYLNDFWKWAERNRTFVDFSKLEENLLGIEPAWVKEQRKADIKKADAYKLTRWTSAEDSELKRLLKTYRYTYFDLSKKLGRTCGAIQRRICDLQLKERPVKADTAIKWTDEEFKRLADLIKSGTSYPLMAEQLGKSEKAIRGKVGWVYKTENLDAVMKMIGSGTWGDGKPVPLVKQDFRKAAVRNDLSRLARALLMHRNQLSFGGYWQKDMCAHWDDVKGCAAGESDCDSCTSYQRIKEQFCRRCGATIWDRKEKHICNRCAEMRKKQAQRKFAIMHSRGAWNNSEEEAG